MVQLPRSLARFPAMLRHQPWSASTALAPNLSMTKLVEEEESPYFNELYFHNTQIGQVLGGRYQVAAKLDNGAKATVWLARDLNQFKWAKEKYVALKIQGCEQDGSRYRNHSEIETLKLVTKANRRHNGYRAVRTLLDYFQIPGSNGYRNDCMVFEPMREPWATYRERWRGNRIEPAFVKVDIVYILRGLDYLHSQCNIIHADLKPDNILVRFEPEYNIGDIAKHEYDNPLPQKHRDDGRVIYLSRNNAGDLQGITGMPEIIDYDSAVWGPGPHSGGSIATRFFESPESIIDSGFSYSADIWSLGLIILELLVGECLVLLPPGSSEELILKDRGELRLAFYTALLGPAPSSLVSAGSRSSSFFDSNNQLKYQELIPKDFQLDNIITMMTGENKELFIKFILRMLAWRPEDRSTAKELSQDPWLHSHFEDEDNVNDYPFFYEENPYPYKEG